MALKERVNIFMEKSDNPEIDVFINKASKGSVLLNTLSGGR